MEVRLQEAHSVGAMLELSQAEGAAQQPSTPPLEGRVQSVCDSILQETQRILAQPSLYERASRVIRNDFRLALQLLRRGADPRSTGDVHPVCKEYLAHKLLQLTGDVVKDHLPFARECIQKTTACFRDISPRLRNDISLVQWTLERATFFGLLDVLMHAGPVPQNDEATLRLFVRLIRERDRSELNGYYSLLTQGVDDDEAVAFCRRFLSQTRPDEDSSKTYRETLDHLVREFPSFLISVCTRSLPKITKGEDLRSLLKLSEYFLEQVHCADDVCLETTRTIGRLVGARAQEIGVGARAVLEPQ